MIDDDAMDTSVEHRDEMESTEISPSGMRQKRAQLRHNQLIRENRRIRNSASFRIGKLCTRAVTKPWLLPVLPFSVMILLFSIGMERLGRWPVPDNKMGGTIKLSSERRDCVIFFPTNGVGFGHFTRMYALAKRYKKYSPSTEIVFFTTMPTLHLLYNEGFVTYHLAGRKKFTEASAGEWNALVEEHLSLAFNQHQPSTFIFDGAFPYRGMLNAIKDQIHTRKIWMRRGTFKKGTRIPVDSIAHFDTIVHPQDSVPLAENEVDHGVESITCAPIVLLDESDLLPRDAARRRLNLPVDGRVVYVQLGAGRINDIDSEIRLTVEALLERDDITVVVGESMLGERIELNMDRVVLLRDYPNSMYFNAFDATVLAGGYNSFHETRRFALPALFYPNMETGMDDQLARCKVSEEEGWGHVVVHRDEASIRHGVELLLASVRATSREPVANGATEVYTALTNHNPSSFNENWMLPSEAFAWIEANIPKKSTVLEFGSGDGSQRLAKRFDLWSIEHDEQWIGKTKSKYVLSKIVKNPASEQAGEEGWYDPAFFDKIPDEVELIVVDGPVGTIGRSGILHHLEKLPRFRYIMVDDTDRPEEEHLSRQLAARLKLRREIIDTAQEKHNGTRRRFDILYHNG